MIERMGFEKNRRIIRQYGNTRVTATVGENKCYFRSKLEYHWALYLEFLKTNGEIIKWEYEPKVFYFPDEKTAPVQYKPDFRVTEKDGTVVWHETKGYHDGKTNKKFQRMAKHYPNVIMDLVLQSIPRTGSKGANRRFNAQRYVRRIVDSSTVFSQMKGIINFNLPKISKM
ncbi:MAG: DUF1064 domain-containing protein [candidate division Zixibacteria bacterium]|nr:DUF1064 domain-containing protein [candidate division Zixibacteria bacterium]